MVPSRPKSNVYNCFIQLSGILHEIDINHKETSIALSIAIKNRREMMCVYWDVIKCTPNSPVQVKIWHENLRFRCDITETPNRPSLSICGVLTLRYSRGKHVSANHEEGKLAKIPDHLIKNVFILLCILIRQTLQHWGILWCYLPLSLIHWHSYLFKELL